MIIKNDFFCCKKLKWKELDNTEKHNRYQFPYSICHTETIREKDWRRKILNIIVILLFRLIMRVKRKYFPTWRRSHQIIKKWRKKIMSWWINWRNKTSSKLILVFMILYYVKKVLIKDIPRDIVIIVTIFFMFYWQLTMNF